MSALRRFTTNGNTHINGRYCDANEAMKLIEQQAAEIDALKARIERLQKAMYKTGELLIKLGKIKEFEELDHALCSTPQQNLAERHADDLAVDKFASQMKGKLAVARSKGRNGWDDPSLCSVESLAEMLVGHLKKANAGNYIDIANFCMMLHLRGAEPIYLAAALAEHDVEVLLKLADYMEEGFGIPMTMGCDEVREYAQRIKDGE